MRQIDSQPFLSSEEIALKSSAVAKLSKRGRLACLCFGCLKAPAQIVFVFLASIVFLVGVVNLFRFTQNSFVQHILEGMEKPRIYACTAYLPSKHLKKPYVESCGVSPNHDCSQYVKEVKIEDVPIDKSYYYPIPQGERLCFSIDYLPDQEQITRKGSYMSISVVQELKREAVENIFDADGDLENFDQAVELTTYPAPIFYLIVHPTNDRAERSHANNWVYTGAVGAYHASIEATEVVRRGKDIVPLPIGIPVKWEVDFAYRTSIYSTPFGMLGYKTVCFKNDPQVKECGAASVMTINFGAFTEEWTTIQAQLFMMPLFTAGGLYSIGLIFVMMLLVPLQLLCTPCRQDYAKYLRRKRELLLTKRMASDIELRRNESDRNRSQSITDTIRDAKAQFGFPTLLEDEQKRMEGQLEAENISEPQTNVWDQSNTE